MACGVHLERMLAHARHAGNGFEASIAVTCRGWNLVEGPLPVAAGLERVEELRREAAGLPAAEATLDGCRAALMSLQGAVDDATPVMAAVRERLTALGLRELTAYMAVLDAQRLRLAGRHAAASRALRDAGSVWSASGDCWMEAVVRVNLAGAIVAQGRLDDAAAAIDHADDLPSPVDRVWVVKRHVARAGVASARGRHDDAIAEARAAVAATAGTGLLLYAAEASHALAAVLDAVRCRGRGR